MLSIMYTATELHYFDSPAMWQARAAESIGTRVAYTWIAASDMANHVGPDIPLAGWMLSLRHPGKRTGSSHARMGRFYC